MATIRKGDRWWQKAASTQFPSDTVSSEAEYKDKLAGIFKDYATRTVPPSMGHKVEGWEPNFYKQYGQAGAGKYYTPMGERAEVFNRYGKGGSPDSGWSNLYGYDVPSGGQYKFFKDALDKAHSQTGIDPRDITMGQPVTLEFLDQAVRENLKSGAITVQSGGYQRDPRQKERTGNSQTNPMWKSAWDAKGNPAEGLMRIMDPSEDLSMYSQGVQNQIKSMVSDPEETAVHELYAHMLSQNLMSLGADGSIHHGSANPMPSGFRHGSDGAKDYMQLMSGISDKASKQDALYKMSYYNPQSELAEPYRGFVANAMSKILTDDNLTQSIPAYEGDPYYAKNTNEIMSRALTEYYSQLNGNPPKFQMDPETIQAISDWTKNLPKMKGEERSYLRTI
jgi:hypothetical protein